MATSKAAKIQKLFTECNLDEKIAVYKEIGRLMSEVISTSIADLNEQKGKLEEIREKIQNS